MDNDNWVKKCMTLKVNGRRDPGRPKKTWEQVIASDLRELGVTWCLAQDRLNWRKTIVMNSLTDASMESGGRGGGGGGLMGQVLDTMPQLSPWWRGWWLRVYSYPFWG